MCHFFANPLSIWSNGGPSNINDMLQPEHFNAVRTLPSFRKRIGELLDDGNTVHARILLDDDNALLLEIQETLQATDQVLLNMLRSMHVLTKIGPETIDRIDLYEKAFSGKLQDADDLTSTIDRIKKMGSEDLVVIMEHIFAAIKIGEKDSDLDGWESEEEFISKVGQLQQKIDALVASSGKPLRSKYTLQSETLRTTIVAQRVQLSRKAAVISSDDAAYSELLDQFISLLEETLTFPNPQELFLNEIWLYDLKSPHRDVFTPRPRFAIERALSAPHDYLGCSCCKPSSEGLSSSQPPTAIVYQLYLESGTLVNVYDLWSAFYAIVGGEDGEECDERHALVLFYRGLAELKMAGLIKHSRKKTDHLAKLGWKSL